MRERTLSSCFLYVKSRLCKTGKNTLKVLLQCISLPGRMEDLYFLFCPFIFHNMFPGPWAVSEGVVTFLRCILPTWVRWLIASVWGNHAACFSYLFCIYMSHCSVWLKEEPQLKNTSLAKHSSGFKQAFGWFSDCFLL